MRNIRPLGLVLLVLFALGILFELILVGLT